MKGLTQYQLAKLACFAGMKAAVIGMALLSISGCESIGYYSQAIVGHSQIIFNQQKIDDLITNPSTEASFKQQLQLSQDALMFARQALGLPVSNSYTKYVDTQRDYVVWNVVATPPYSVEPIVHCFPIAGCVSYKGFYALDSARAYALKLKDEGRDVSIGGVAAYSTLGWFDDPLLNTMLKDDEAQLVGTLIHELTHQQVYVKDDTAFNESFATAVEELGLQQWLLGNQKDSLWQQYQTDKNARHQVVELILSHRETMADAYAHIAEEQDEDKQSLKETLFSDLKQAYLQLQLQFREQGLSYDRFDQWFKGDLNNASLVLFADYHRWVPAFKQLREQSSSWTAFYARVENLAQLDSPRRAAQLQQLYDLRLATHEN